MSKLTEVRGRLRQKKTEYKDLRNDYDLLIQNVKANVATKKTMRYEILALTKQYQELKLEDEIKNKIDQVEKEAN